MSTQPQRRYTEEEYLALERRAELKSEFIEGRIVGMVGTTRPHNLIVGNVFVGLHTQFRGRPCEVYVNDLRVRVAPGRMYTYPDVAALCGEARLADDHKDTLLNPSVIVEVLSESTERYDRGEKFAYCRRMESLREYVLIAQDRPRVELFVRDGESWILSEADGLDAVVSLPSVDARLPLREIYERVELAG